MTWSLDDNNENEAYNGSLNQATSKVKETVIAKGTKIVGNMKIDGDLVIEGTIVGNVECSNKTTVCGIVDGDIETGCIMCNEAIINGNVKCADIITLGEATTVIGNCESKDMVCGGRVKGNVYLEKSITLKETAAIVGEVSALDIEISRGAVIQGKLDIRQEISFEN